IAGYAVPFAIRLNAQLPVPDLHCLVIELPWRANANVTMSSISMAEIDGRFFQTFLTGITQIM
ncbi:MAG: hypothetical protein ACYCSO_09725, partial [Cuniculiplasma sp.]